MRGSGVNRTDGMRRFVSGNLRFGQDRSFLRILSVVVVTCQPGSEAPPERVLSTGHGYIIDIAHRLVLACLTLASRQRITAHASHHQLTQQQREAGKWHFSLHAALL